MSKRQAKTNRTSPIYSVGQTVNVSKEKRLYAKGFEQNWTSDVFRISNDLHRPSRPVYDLEDLRGEPIEVQLSESSLQSRSRGGPST